jgi:DNA-binding SARP family transcriptional activator
VRFKILGSLTVEGDAGPILVSGSRRRALLLRLLVPPNHPVSDGRLTEDLWDGEPPAGAVSTLASHVSLLRQVIGRDRIARRAGGYVLVVGPEEVDALCFEEEAKAGDAAFGEGKVELARRLFETALERWRGPALMDVHDMSWAGGETARLEELRRTSQESLMDACLALGEHHQLVAALESAVAEDPLRERRWRQLMIALYRSGRQADALHAYQRLRSFLGDQLGIEPSAELTLLEQSIILQKPELDWEGANPWLAGTAESRARGAGLSRPARAPGSGVRIDLPLPGRLGDRPPPHVIGRAAEETMIAASVARVASGAGREVCLIAGEAGMGKTTLAAITARAALDQGACVLFGHCEEDLSSPYQLFAEALTGLVSELPDAQLLPYLEEFASELAGLVPALKRRIAGLPPSKAVDSEAERYLLFAAVVGAFASISRHQVVVLVLDDLQWADRGSLQLLRHLVAAPQQMRLLIVGTYRNPEFQQSEALLETIAAMHRQKGFRRIELNGLDESEVMSLMEAIVGRPLDRTESAGLAAAVYGETDGNPFFVNELLRHLSETGALSEDSGSVAADGVVRELVLPDSIREVVRARLLRLGPEAGRVLSVAAVIGGDFEIDLLGRASATREDELLDILEAASAAALVREPEDVSGRFRFTHALIGRTLYEGLGAHRRAQAHRAVATALEEICGQHPGTRIGELARHWSSARPLDAARAVGYARQAGDAALRSLAPTDALRYYSQALELLTAVDGRDPVLELDLAIGRGTAQRQIGDPSFRSTLLSAARQAADLGDTGRLVRAALANNRGWLSSAGAVDAEKVEILELLLDRVPPGTPERALVLAALCSELAYGSSLERRQSLAQEAIVIARSSDDDATIVRVLNHVFIPLLVPSLQEEALVRTADAMTRAERVGDPVILNSAAVNRAITAGRAGDFDELDRSIGVMRTMAERLDQPNLRWEQLFIRATRALIAGDTEVAEELATESLRIGSDCGQPDAALIFGAQLMMVSLQRGTLNDLVPLMEQWASEIPSIDRGVLHGVLAHAHAEGDHFEDACRLLREFGASGFELPLDGAWFTGMTAYSEAAIACLDAASARPLLERLEPWAGLMSYTGTTVDGPISHCLGGLCTVLGRYDEADAYFGQSASFSQKVGAKFFGARTDLLWGKMLLARALPGDGDRARVTLARARAAAVANGYGNIIRRCELVPMT